jgi:hypothetical protein
LGAHEAIVAGFLLSAVIDIRLGGGVLNLARLLPFDVFLIVDGHLLEEIDLLYELVELNAFVSSNLLSSLT